MSARLLARGLSLTSLRAEGGGCPGDRYEKKARGRHPGKQEDSRKEPTATEVRDTGSATHVARGLRRTRRLPEARVRISGDAIDGACQGWHLQRAGSRKIPVLHFFVFARATGNALKDGTGMR
jgi:hypothetical protein